MFHAYIIPIATCFIYTLYGFYAFSGTNLLTRCHSASSLFSAVFGFTNPLKEIFSELDETKTKGLRISETFQKSEGVKETGPEAPTSRGGAAPPLAVPGPEVGPSGLHRLRPFAYIYRPTK